MAAAAHGAARDEHEVLLAIAPRQCDRRPAQPAAMELKILPHEKPEEFQDDARARRAGGFRRYRRHRALAIGGLPVSCPGGGAMEPQSDIPSRGLRAPMPPFLGQGMCAGIRDAANLIWKLLLVEKSGSSDRPVHLPGRAQTHVQNVVAQAKELGLVIGELDVEAATNAMRVCAPSAPAGNRRGHRSFRRSRGLIDRDHRAEPTRAAGSLFPQPRVTTADGRIALPDDPLPPAFLVISSTMDAQAALGGRETAISAGSLRFVSCCAQTLTRTTRFTMT